MCHEGYQQTIRLKNILHSGSILTIPPTLAADPISNQKFNDALKEIMKAVCETKPESTLAGYVTKAYTADVGKQSRSQNRYIPAMADGELSHRAPLIRHQYATTR